VQGPSSPSLACERAGSERAAAHHVLGLAAEHGAGHAAPAMVPRTIRSAGHAAACSTMTSHGRRAKHSCAASERSPGRARSRRDARGRGRAVASTLARMAIATRASSRSRCSAFLVQPAAPRCAGCQAHAEAGSMHRAWSALAAGSSRPPSAVAA